MDAPPDSRVKGGSKDVGSSLTLKGRLADRVRIRELRLIDQEGLDIIGGMRPTTPLLSKTPFAIDPRPIRGATSARAGVAAISRVYRSLQVPGLVTANVGIKQRQRGYEAGQYVESLALLHAAGGDCVEDLERLRADDGLQKILGYKIPSARATQDFLEQFHDGALIEKARRHADQQGQLAFIVEENGPLQGLQRVNSAAVRSLSRRLECPQTATVDLDATVIESHKQSAKPTYDGRRGYQPVVAVWAETGLVLADEFRDGNVPAAMAPLNCARTAFATLPAGLKQYYFRGDRACHERDLLAWLCDEQRASGPQGNIGFAISARMTAELARSVQQIRESAWKTIETEADGTRRQWAEVDFIPHDRYEQKTSRPLRYLAIRLIKAQGDLFADGADRQHFTVVTNRTEDGAFLLNWQRLKAGTIEHVHDELKNGLGAGRMPSGKFGANAAWFRIACLTLNLVEGLRRAWADDTVLTAKLKRVRFEIFTVTGRVVRDGRKISLRLCASKEWIANFIALFEAFPLVTRATG